MTTTDVIPSGNKKRPSQRYRLPGIEREGIAQLSLLETALWPLQGGKLPSNMFETEYAFTTAAGRRTGHVTVRAPWDCRPSTNWCCGACSAPRSPARAEPVLLATPYWMLRIWASTPAARSTTDCASRSCGWPSRATRTTASTTPRTEEHEYAAFQFLSILLPTVGGVGETVDNDRCWRIEWNPAFFRFCQATGGNLLFDLDLYRQLTPASRRLFLKLKDRFWRSKRVFMNVDD